MRVVLINLFTPYEGTRCTSGMVHLEPLGIEYVGAIAKAVGHDVKILSATNPENIEIFAEEIIKESPDVIGIGPATYNFNQAKALTRILKGRLRDVVAIFGGYHVTALPEEVEDPAIDIVVQGEGEYTFVEVLECLKDKKSLDHVAGIAYKKYGKVVINPRRDRIKEIDNLPLPLRSATEMSQYRCKGFYYPSFSEQISVAQIVYSRGCPYNCSYCSSGQLWGNSVIYRNPEKVVDELQYVKDNFGTNLVFFADLTFNLHKHKVLELCECIARKGIKMSWFCGCRPEGIDEELLSAMKGAGCTRIHYGIEAVDEYSVKKINRKKSYETVEKTLELTSKAGIITRAYLMIGYPWETRANLESINANLNKLYIDDLRISFFTPFPGTRIYAQYIDAIRSRSWDEFTTDKPLIPLSDMTREEILLLRDRIFDNFFTSVEYQKRVQWKIATFPYLKRPFIEFLNDLSLKNGSAKWVSLLKEPVDAQDIGVTTY